MVKKTVIKGFPNGIVSLPFGHKNLKQIDDFKKEKGQKIEKYLWEEKEVLLNVEKNALKSTPRLYFYHQVLMSSPKIFNTKQKNDSTQQERHYLNGTLRTKFSLENG